MLRPITAAVVVLKVGPPSVRWMAVSDPRSVARRKAVVIARGHRQAV